ncbi:MAG: hypothetical protein JOZ36_04530 [Acidobacteria bacterium]|nr:hypothetical protein [Acidobacteriota bacterium]
MRKSLQRAFRFWLVPFAFLPFTAAFAALSLAGGVLLIRDRRLSATGILAVPILYPLIYSITHIETRYRHPIEPVLCLLSAYGLCELLEYARVAKKWTGESSKREKTGAVSGLDLIADVQTGTRSPELPRRPEATNPLR